MGLGLTGKLGRAWHGALHGALPGLVRLDLSIGGGLDGDGEGVVGVVSCEMEINLMQLLLYYLQLQFTCQIQ